MRERITVLGMSWWQYVVRVAATSEQKQIAEKSGIGTTVISRWHQSKNEPSAKNVITFARAYGRPPIEALIAAGFLRPEEAGGQVELYTSLKRVDADALLREIGRRLRLVEATGHDGKQRLPKSNGSLKFRGGELASESGGGDRDETHQLGGG